MVKFSVSGEYSRTGQPCAITLLAIDESDAWRSALGRGITVVSVKRIDAPPTEPNVPSAMQLQPPGTEKPNSSPLLIICPNPNCGYRGEGIVHGAGSKDLRDFLLFFFLVPGIVYGVFFYERPWLCCPDCQMKAREFNSEWDSNLGWRVGLIVAVGIGVILLALLWPG